MADSTLLSPYEQIWKTRDLRALGTPIELENKLPEWKRGLGAFGKEMQATGYGLVALGSQGLENIVGKNNLTDSVTNWGVEGYNKSIEESQSGYNAPSVAKIEDIKTASDAMDWASYQLGKGLPMLASLAASGGIGGAVARIGAKEGIKQLAKSAVGDVVKKGVATQAVKATEGQIVTKAMQEAAAKSLRDTMTKGAIAGGFTGSFGLEGGQAFGEQVAEGVNPADAVKSAIAVGGINGALEFLPLYSAAKSIGLGKYAKNSIVDIIKNDAGLSKKAIALATAKELGGRAAKGAAVGAGVEGITEGLQELVAVAGLRWAKEEPLFAQLTEDDWSRVNNAILTGGLVGGVAAGAGATFSGGQGGEKKTTPSPIATPAGTKTPDVQTREQVLEAKRAELIGSIKSALAANDVKKAEELQQIKILYDTAIESEKKKAAQTPATTGATAGINTAPPIAEPTGTDNSQKPLPDATKESITVNEESDQQAKAKLAEEERLAALALEQQRREIERQQDDPFSLVLESPEAAPQPQPENQNDSRNEKGQAQAQTSPLLNQEPISPVAPVAGETAPTTTETKTDVKPTADNQPLYSKPISEPAPTFFSALERAMQEVKQQKAPAAQWESSLDNMVKKGTIKQEELDWSGTKEWLREQKEPVTKEALLQHVRDNTLEVQEVNFGENSVNPITGKQNDDTVRNEKRTLPGSIPGTQQELILTTPSIDPFNTDDTTHYGDVGRGRAVAWVRFNSRADKDGKQVLFIEEVQSKRPVSGSGSTLSGWAGLAFKRMLRYAAENGYDKVSWTTGEQQAKRYSLSNYVSKLRYYDNGMLEGFGSNPFSYAVSKEELPNYVGKEVADTLLSQPTNKYEAVQEDDFVEVTDKEGLGYKELEFPEGIVVGGEGMKGFYDRLLPNEINKYVKKWGTKVDKTEMKFGDETAAVHSIEITPAMRDSVMQGQPLFSKEADAQNAPALGVIKSSLQEVQSSIDSVMGNGWLQQAINLGLVEVIDGAGPNGEAGSWAGNTIRLYAGSMPKNGSPIGVLLHEGKHATFADVLGNTISDYVKDLHTLANNGNKAAQDAIIHAVIAAADVLNLKHNLLNGGNKTDVKNLSALIEELKPGLLAEEELAYFVQYGTETQSGVGFLRRLVNKIKAWFAQTRFGQRMKELGMSFEMTEGMAVEWAKMGLNRSLETLKNEEKLKSKAFAKAKTLPPSARFGKALSDLSDFYSFAGKTATTADLSSLQKAELRVKNGENAESVRKDTGWFQGADGKWRFEIDDSKANWVISFEDIPESKIFEKESAFYLDEILNHPDLFAAYPQLNKISVIKRAALGDTDKAYQGWFNNTALQVGITPYATNPMSTLLHEIQHVIQMYEGFPAGGSEQSVWTALPKETKENIAKGVIGELTENAAKLQNKLNAFSLLEKNANLIAELSTSRKAVLNLTNNYISAMGKPNSNGSELYALITEEDAKVKRIEKAIVNLLGFSDKQWVHDISLEGYQAVNDALRFYEKNSTKEDIEKYKNGVTKDITATIEKLAKIKSGDENAIRSEANLYEFYKRLAGETEARLTQARQNMTADERKEISPKSMQDYPDNELIIVNQDPKESTYYSMGIQEIKDNLWTDPTDSRVEMVNRPGLLQRWRADFVDFFAEIEKKSEDIYETYSLLRSKKAARIERSRQEYLLPLRELIAGSPWNAKEVGDMYAARHIKVDKVNTRLAERASYIYTKDLLKSLTNMKRNELKKARVNIKGGRNPDGTAYVDENGNKITMTAITKQKLMFDLMNKYAPFEIIDSNGKQPLREEWELFKDAAGGFSDGGVGKNFVRTVDEVLAAANKDKEKFEKLANLFDALNRQTLEIKEEGGLITAGEHARLLTDKSAYAPLRRESYNVNQEIERIFQQSGRGGSKLLSTRSGTANLSEPTLVLQNALAALEAAAAAAERNLANKELYEVITANREEWKPWFTIVDKDEYATHDEDGFLQEKKTTAVNQADIILIYDGNKMVIRPNMHNERAIGFVRAANNLDAQILSGPMKVLNWLNGIVRWVNVSASPVFLMTNAIRDPFTAAYNLKATEAAPYAKDIFLNYKSSFTALKKVFLDGNRDPTDADVQWVERFELAGGRTSFVESLREMDDTWRSFDAQVARRQGNMKYLMQAKDKWLDGIENLNILFENVMRFSTFKTLVEKGVVSDRRAAKISQDLTTNFSRRGYKTQMLGVWWLFFNATVQGNYQVARNLIQSKKLQVAVGKTIVAALLLDLLGRAVADDWDEIPEWDKEKFIIIPIKIGGDFIKIPAPWVFNLFWRAGSMFGETLSGKRKAQDMLLDLAALTTTTLSPLGRTGSIAQAVSPTGADPFVQILENKDFAGNPLGPEGFPGAGSKANSELLWGKTPKGYQEFARFVNEATGGSATESGALDYRPADYQVLVNFLTGSLGRFLTDTTFGLKDVFDKEIEGPKDIPVVKEFFSDPYNPLRSQKYHTNIAGIYGAHKLEQMYLKGPNRDLIKLQEVRKERGEELRMYAQAQDVERQIKSLRVRLRAAQNREDTKSEKDIKQKIEKVQEQFNLRYQQRVK